MTMLKSVVGAALFVYTILYILQVVFSSLYADLLSPSEVWRVMNYVTAVGIIIAAGVAYAHKRRLRPETPAGQTIGALAAFYTTPGAGHMVLHRVVQVADAWRRRVGQRGRQRDLVPDLRNQPIRTWDDRGFALEVGVTRLGCCAGRLRNLARAGKGVKLQAALNSIRLSRQALSAKDVCLDDRQQRHRAFDHFFLRFCTDAQRPKNDGVDDYHRNQRDDDYKYRPKG